MQQETSREFERSFLDFLPKPDVNPIEISTDALAYLGDAIFNLFIKIYTLKDWKVRELHKLSSKYVSREGQSRFLKTILPMLTEEELNIVRRGMNSKGARKHGNDRLYMESTGFEALIGYLYLVNQERLAFLLKEGIRWVEV
ncbi:MAG: Mini-ribonuclease 3 [Fervidobacterium sp.]|uniref:Mini-ribonuclease 3 n=1 Tax=Fervidobacterium sp. TaxID=1871331 RepID=UPI00404B9E6C